MQAACEVSEKVSVTGSYSKAAMPRHDEDFLQLSQYSCCCYNCTSTRQKRNVGMAEYGRVCLKTNRNVSGAQFEILWAWISRLLMLPTAVTPPPSPASTPQAVTTVLSLDYVAWCLYSSPSGLSYVVLDVI